MVYSSATCCCPATVVAMTVYKRCRCSCPNICFKKNHTQHLRLSYRRQGPQDETLTYVDSEIYLLLLVYDMLRYTNMCGVTWAKSFNSCRFRLSGIFDFPPVRQNLLWILWYTLAQRQRGCVIDVSRGDTCERVPGNTRVLPRCEGDLML